MWYAYLHFLLLHTRQREWKEKKCLYSTRTLPANEQERNEVKELRGENIHCWKNPHTTYIYSYIKGKNQTWKDGFVCWASAAPNDISEEKDR